MASFLFDLTKYSVTHGCFMYQDYLVRIILRTCHWILSELYQWLVWIFSIFLLRRFAPFIFGFLEVFRMIELIFRFLFHPRSVVWSYTISLKQCKQVATIDAYRASDLIFTSYMLHDSVCYLFLLVREQFYVNKLVSFNLLLRSNDRFLDVSSRTSRFPPEGFILDGILHMIMIFSMTMVFMRAFSWYLVLTLRSRSPFRSKNVQLKQSMSTMRPKQIFTSVYTSEQLEQCMNRVDFDPTLQTAVVDNAANVHIWCMQHDFVPGSLRPISAENACVTTIGGSDHKPVAIGDVRTA